MLHEAFAIDPFNKVCVSNTLKVLEVLSNYSVIETEHFVVKFDRAHDELLARYAAKFLENDVYPPSVKKLGRRANRCSRFSAALATPTGTAGSALAWSGSPISARSVRAPGGWSPCNRPNDSQQKINGRTVLRHEFVHMSNLQQTDFSVPHWFTEALAVHNEGYPRPRLWDELLAQRVPAGKIFNLETINGGFIRPSSSDDWAMAYCQAELYAQYMLDHFGNDAIAKMLAAYADNLNTRAAIRRALGVGQEEFERGYG